jgi:hypothetical protein
VEQDTKSAADFYDDKVKQLASNISDLEAIVQQKTNNLRMVEEGKISPDSVVDQGECELTVVFLRSVTAKGVGKSTATEGMRKARSITNE